MQIHIYFNLHYVYEDELCADNILVLKITA